MIVTTGEDRTAHPRCCVLSVGILGPTVRVSAFQQLKQRARQGH